MFVPETGYLGSDSVRSFIDTSESPRFRPTDRPMLVDGNRNLLTGLGDGEHAAVLGMSTFVCGLKGNRGAVTDEAGGVTCSMSFGVLASGASTVFAELEKENHPRLLLFLLIVGDAGGDSALHCALGIDKLGLARLEAPGPAPSLTPLSHFKLFLFRLSSSSITILAGLKSAKPLSEFLLDCGDGDMGFLGGGVRTYGSSS